MKWTNIINWLFSGIFPALSFSLNAVSFVAACAIVAYIPAENIAKWTWTTSATWSNCIRRLYHCVRCDARLMRIIAIVEPMLFARLCDPIFVCRQIVACTCYTWTVSKPIYFCLLLLLCCSRLLQFVCVCVFFFRRSIHVRGIHYNSNAFNVYEVQTKQKFSVFFLNSL